MVKYCPKCGVKIDGKPERCPNCGNILPVIKEERDISKRQKNKNLSEGKTNFLLKAYLVYGVISIIISLFIMFGLRRWEDKLITGGEILIIFAGLILIVAYNQIFHGKQFASIATVGCIFGIAGSFFPGIYSLNYVVDNILLGVVPAIFFMLMIFYLVFLIVTLLWRNK